ncbi:hypothetical protein VRB78_23030 [Pseudomonas trivialis]|uniref:hypothetical protein n=1 Tax=Pseudomonas trivialis TaxID=200450 RepID=UPI0030CE35C9
MMPFRYRVLSIEPEYYYSEFSLDPLEDDVGFDHKDPFNVVYTKYNKPYARFQYLGGFNLRVPVSVLPVKPQPGDTWNVDMQNITTGDPLAVFNHISTVHPGTAPQYFATGVSIRPGMYKLGPGVIEVDSYFTSISTNTIYIFPTRQITLVMP